VEEIQRATGEVEAAKPQRGRACIACGHEIPVARIKLMPGALRCVSCQLRLEGTTLPGEPA
jgi:RNA polymerase-binding transcription factor DksA